ncbi:DUF6527 family protein [Pararhizobium sp. LjRoot255]|uniref:DUF6527 family protein n=1 Tax=Pararhizobium sp. LjRoot255 TaxID=3342298 RepID=UPI003F4F997E
MTPLNPAKWRLVESVGSASLSPSVGNWSFPCRSHYWITGNQVRWAAAMSAEKIAAVKARDRRDVEAMVLQPRGLFVRFIDAVAAKVAGWFRR